MRTRDERGVRKTSSPPAIKSIKVEHFDDFIKSNPTLWAVAWALTWRMLALAFGVYLFVVVAVAIIVTFAGSLIEFLA